MKNLDKKEELTKREYFTGLAMQGMLANSALCQNIKTIEQVQLITDASIVFADELLKQLQND